MNLNECIMNPGNKSKVKKTFVITNKVINERQDNASTRLSLENTAFSHFPKNINSTKKNSTAISGTNWGSDYVSFLNSSSSRKSSSSKVNSDNHSKIIVALTEGRGQARCEVGIAVMTISSHHLIICQISDSQNYINTLTKINVLNPTEILFPNTFEHFGGNRLISRVKEQFPNIRYIGIPRNLFNKMSGSDMLSQLCVPSLNGILLVLQHRYYALAAACALLTYIQDNLYIYYAGGSLKIDYQESEGYAIIDVSTADRLELVCSTKPVQASKFSSLLGILNYCQTKMGTRKLRSWILQPPSNVLYIEQRLNCVEELMKKPEMLSGLQVMLQKLSSVDALLSLATIIPDDAQKCSVRQLNYMINLNSIIDLVIPLKEIISDLKQPFFVKVRKTLEDSSFIEIKKIVREGIHDYAQPSKGQSVVQQRCFAIKPGVNELLDAIRKVFSERLNSMKEYVEELSEKHNLALTLGNNQKKGYHMVLNLNKAQKKNLKKSDLPDEFIEINQTSSHFTMKTPELVNMSTRIDDITEDILKISNMIVYNMVLNMKQHICLFHQLCEVIAQLDVYQSLAQTSLQNNYVRPKFGEYTHVKFGQHPLLNFLLATKPTANTIFCSDDYNVHIITGPNGSGKSIFIRQMMLLQIMAQLGCYVPAESAIFKPVNRMFARIYLEDNMEYNASSFVLEMKEVKYIMASMTSDSLIIIDELGRSTSVEEGISLAIAILEEMACYTSYIYITTHFTMLAKLSSIYPSIKAWQMETVPHGDDPKTFKLEYRYTLKPGITTVGRYGVYIVRNIWPESIVKDVDNAIDILERKQQKSLVVPSNQTYMLKYQTESELRHLKRLKLLSVTKIKELVLQYQADLKKLNYYTLPSLHINLLSSEDKTVDDPDEYDTGSLVTTQDFLIQKNRIEQVCTPDDSICEYANPNSPGLEISAPDAPFFSPTQSVSEYITSRQQMFPPDLNSSNQKSLVCYTPPSSLQFDGNSSIRSYNECLNYLEPVITITEDSEKLIRPLDISSLVSQEEYKSICNEFFDQPRLPEPKSPNRETTGYDHKENSLLDETSLSCMFSAEEYRSICEEFSQDFVEAPRSGVLNATPNVNCERNTYRYYTSPIIVNVVEGPNDLSLSFGEEDAHRHSGVAEENSKINIVSDIRVREAEKNDDAQNSPDDAETIVEHSENQNNNASKSTFKCEEKEMTRFSSGENDGILETNDSTNNVDNWKNVSNETADDNGKSSAIDADGEVENNLTTKIKNESDVENKECTQPITTTKIKENIEQKTSDTPSTYTKKKRVLPLFNRRNNKQRPLSKNKYKPTSTDSTKTMLDSSEQTKNFQPYTITSMVIYNDDVADCLNKCQRNFDEKSSGYNTVTEEFFRVFPSTTNIEDSEAATKDKIHQDVVEVVEAPTSDSSTNISAASKKRNLDGISNENSTEEASTNGRERNTNDASNKEDAINRNSSGLNLSSASRNRNLDNATGFNTLEDISTESKPSDGFIKDNHCLTSISSASRNRNLSGSPIKTPAALELNSSVDSSTGSLTLLPSLKRMKPKFRRVPRVRPKRDEIAEVLDTPCNTANSSLETSVSSASKKRNLDASSKSTNNDDVSKPNSSAFGSRDRNSSGTTSETRLFEENNESYHCSNKRRKCSKLNKKFVPPRTLSAKQIKKDFEEQDRKLLAACSNEFNMTKFLEQKYKRPSVQQIQNATHVATMRKTALGIEVISGEFENTKRKRTITKTFSNHSVDMSIFSDKNAKSFERFINSKETDLGSFQFGKHKEPPCSNQTAENVYSYYVANNQSTLLGQSASKISLTPHGYYKQNKEDIDAVMCKYLNNTSQRAQNLGDSRYNIFESSNLNNEDLDL